MIRPGWVIWLTGLPASGKTCLARQLIERLHGMGRPTLWLDSDAFRAVMTPAPSYSDEERDRVYATIGEVARWGAEGGVVVVVSATAPRRRYRDAVRQVVRHFVEVLVSCDLDELRRRDPKHLYRDSAAGQVTRLPGVGATYEPPLNPEAVADSGTKTPAELAAEVIQWLQAQPSFDATRPETVV